MRDSRCGCRADWASASAERSTSRNCWLKARTARTRYASAETIARRSTTHRNASIGRPRLWHGPPRRHEDAPHAPRLAGDRALALAMGLCQDAPRAQPECAELIGLYADERRFRSTIDMARYKFGVGEYRYFAAPLPPLVETLRRHAFPPLAAIANRWEAALSGSVNRLASDGGAPAPRRPAARTSVVHPASLLTEPER